MSDGQQPGGPGGYEPGPWSYPPPEEPEDSGQQAPPPQPGQPAWGEQAPWDQQAQQAQPGQPPAAPPPRERPSRLSRPYLDQTGEQPAQRPASGQFPPPPRRSGPYQQPPSVEQHPSGPFDADGAPVRRHQTGPQGIQNPTGPQPVQQPTGPQPPRPSGPERGPGTGPQARPYDSGQHPGARRAPDSGPQRRGVPGQTPGTGPQRIIDLTGGPEPGGPEPGGPRPAGPGSSRSGQFPAPGGQEHPSGPFDRAGKPAEPQAPPAGRTGRQARLKAGPPPGGHEGQPGKTSSGPLGRKRPSLNGGGSGGRRANVAMAAVLLVVAVGAAAVVTRLPARQQRATAAAATVAAPYSSRWLCPVMPGAGTQVMVANAGKDAAQLKATLSTADPADATRPAQRRALATGGPLAAGAARAVKLDPKQPGLLELESFGAPVAVGAPGLPTCSASAAERWWLTAADTSQGDVDVVLANPGNEGAVVQLVLHTSNIPYRPGALKRVFVPAHSAVSEKLNKYAELDMSVEVVALLGRVVAGALSTAPGAKTPVVIPGQPGAQPAWLFAGGRGGKGDSTSLALVNPSLDPLVVDVRVVTAKDAFTPPGFEDLEIPSGTTRRVPLSVSNAPGGAMGVEVRSRTGEPFAASLVVRPKLGSGAPYIDGGSPRLWERWFLPVAGAKGSVVLANLGSGQVAATIADLGNPGAAGQPVRVPAGRVVVKQLDAAKGGVVIDGDHGNLVVTQGAGGAVPSVMVDGTTLPGPVLEGPAAG